MNQTMEILTTEIQTITPSYLGVLEMMACSMLDSSFHSNKEIAGTNVDGTLLMKASLVSGDTQWSPKDKSVTPLKH